MNNISIRKIALVGGVSLLIMAVAAMFATLFVHNQLIVSNNITLTVEKIQQSLLLWRWGILSFFIVIVCDIVVTWALYIFFKPKNSGLSLLTAIFRLIYTAVLVIAVLNHVKVLVLLSNVESFSTEYLYNQVLLYCKAFNMEWSMGLILFGIHLCLLACLVLKSNFFSKLLFGLLMLAGLSYIINNISALLWINYENYKSTFEMVLGLPMAIGELTLAFYLLIKGGKELE